MKRMTYLMRCRRALNPTGNMHPPTPAPAYMKAYAKPSLFLNQCVIVILIMVKNTPLVS